LRAEKAEAAFAAAAKFSWSRCARETFDFLAAVARDYREVSQNEPSRAG
jgi:hypothetical protein